METKTYFFFFVCHCWRGNQGIYDMVLLVP